MKWADDSFTEYYVTDLQTEAMTFTGYDQSIISVDAKGIVTALKKGETEVTVTLKGKTCKIKVVVSDKAEDGFYRLSDVIEVDYTDLDFSGKGTMSAISSQNSATITFDEGEGAIKAVVTGGDALFYLGFSQSTPALKAQDYATLEITYKCPTNTSGKAVNLQVFYCAGSIQNADAAHQVMKSITKDGEYHTITIDLSTFKDWDGNINTLRIDFFDQSEVGDTMYIKSIKLIEK
jgi:hypothetical protein